MVEHNVDWIPYSHAFYVFFGRPFHIRDLSFNDLTTLEEGIFEGTPSLEIL